jgi:hypothetical protein
VRFSSTISILFIVVGTVVTISSEANAYHMECDNRQYNDKPVVANAVSADISVPYGYLCHMIEAKGKDISEQKAVYASNASMTGPLVKGIGSV